MIRFFGVFSALVRGLKSRTTRDQWSGNALLLTLCAAVGALLVSYGDVDRDSVMNGIVLVLGVAGPYFARAVNRVHLWLNSGHIDSSLFCVKARRHGATIWREFHGALRDALEEGYDFAVLEDGREVKLGKFMEATGHVLRLKPVNIATATKGE